jgi:C-terminal peptidase prc
MGKSRSWLWFTLNALLPFTLANANPTTEAEEWATTKFPLTLRQAFISDEKCHSSEIRLAACRKALRTAQDLSLVEPETELVWDFETALNSLETQIPRSIPLQMFRAKVVNSYLNFFDAHAAIKPSAARDQAFAGANHSFVGIGVVIEPTSEGIVVREVHAASPAAQAGLQVEDLILAVATKTSRPFENVGIDLDKTGDLIRGPRGSALVVRVRRGPDEFEFTIKRASISVPSVSGSVNGGIGYLRITSFTSYAVCSLMIQQLNQMKAQGLEKLILDLRGNPGGDKGMSICAAELFLGPRHVVGTRSIRNSIPGLDEIMQVNATEIQGRNEIVWEGGYLAQPKFAGPMVVLVDALSASGSEIVAGALQDHQRAWLIGERTFGKGTVQSDEFIPGHSSLSLKHTIERFYLPSGRSNQAIGLLPNFEVSRRGGSLKNRSPVSLREVNLFPASLGPQSTVWSETRPSEAAALFKCASDRPTSGEKLDSDHPRAFALAVLGCL